MSKRTIVGFLLAVAIFAIGAGAASAQVKPGDMITYENMEKVRNLVSPGVMYKLNQGMSMKIVTPSRLDWPPPFKEATEKYSAQVRLSEDKRSLVGYVAGQPFPLIDPNDPDVAVKIAWNNQFRPALGDDYDLRFFDCPTVYGGRGKSYNMIYDITVGHYSGYSYVNRTEVEPLPVDPEFKERGVLWAWLGSPVISPQQDRGIGGLRYRYADPRRPDDFWAYAPSTRRLRRVNESAADMSTFPFPWNPDNYSGFVAKVEEWDFKFLGEKEMLAPVHAEHSPAVTCATDGGASTCQQLGRFFVVGLAPQAIGVGPRAARKFCGAIDFVPIRRVVEFEFAQAPIDAESAEHLQVGAGISGVGIQDGAVPIEKDGASGEAASGHGAMVAKLRRVLVRECLPAVITRNAEEANRRAGRRCRRK